MSAPEKPVGFYVVTDPDEDFTEGARFGTLEAAEERARECACQLGEMTVWHCVPVALYRPREPERVDLTGAASVAAFDADDPTPVPQHGSGEWQDCRDDYYMPRHLYGGQMVELHFDGDAEPSGVRVEARSANWREAIRYRVSPRLFDMPAPGPTDPDLDALPVARLAG